MSTNNTIQYKVAERIKESLETKGYIENLDIKRFTEFKREDGKEVIKYLIELVDEESIKANLLELYRQRHFYRYDSRLELLAIWIAFDTSVKKSFDPENII